MVEWETHGRQCAIGRLEVRRLCARQSTAGLSDVKTGEPVCPTLRRPTELWAVPFRGLQLLSTVVDGRDGIVVTVLRSRTKRNAPNLERGYAPRLVPGGKGARGYNA